MGTILVLPFISGEPLYQVLLILSMFLTGFYNALWKEPVMVLGGKRLILLRSVFVLGIVLVYSIFSGFGSIMSYFSTQSLSFWVLLLISLFSYPGLYFFVKAIKSGPSSVVIPTCSISIIAPVLYMAISSGFDFLNEHYIFGFLLIFWGLLLLKFRFSEGRIKYMGDAGFRYSILSIFFMGTVFIASNNMAYSAGQSDTLLVQEGSILIGAFLHILVSRYIGKNKAKKSGKTPYRWTQSQLMNHWRHYSWIIATIGILSGLAVVFRMISNPAPLPMATTILSFSPIISVFVAINYYSEKLKIQQILAVAFLFVGIFIISWKVDGQPLPSFVNFFQV